MGIKPINLAKGRRYVYRWKNSEYHMLYFLRECVVVTCYTTNAVRIKFLDNGEEINCSRMAIVEIGRRNK